LSDVVQRKIFERVKQFKLSARCNTWRDRGVRTGALKNYEKYVFARYMLPHTSVIDFRNLKRI